MGNESQSFHETLCNQQPIEGIPMVHRELADFEGVIDRHRQSLERLFLQHAGESPRNGELSESSLEDDLPDVHALK